MRPALALLCLAACAEFPALDARLDTVDRTAPAPALVPLDGLLAAADAQAAAAPPTPALPRAAALAARAEALRGAVLTDEERARLAAAPSPPPAAPLALQ